MPQLKQIPSLEEHAIKRIALLIINAIFSAAAEMHNSRDQEIRSSYLKLFIEKISIYASYIPPRKIYAEIAFKVLKSVQNFIQKHDPHPGINIPNITHNEQFDKEINNLAIVILVPNLQSIYFNQWPIFMQLVMFNNLLRMNNLRIVNFGPSLDLSRYIKNQRFHNNILNSLKRMKSLQKFCLYFHCNDAIIKTLSENCPLIKTIKIKESADVTDRSVPYLLKCKQLKCLDLFATKISTKGLAVLICGLPLLENIFHQDNYAVEYLSQDRSFRITEYDLPNSLVFQNEIDLKKIEVKNVDNKQLGLIVKLFPKVQHIVIHSFLNTIDLTILNSLKYLRNLSVAYIGFKCCLLQELLQNNCTNLTTLILMNVKELNSHAIVVIGKCCLKLKQLELHYSLFLASLHLNIPCTHQPFQNLTHLVWNGVLCKCSVFCNESNSLEYILMNATNIHYISISSSSNITDKYMGEILESNPMKYLEKFQIRFNSKNLRIDPDYDTVCKNLSINTVNLLLSKCSNLKVLSGLHRWGGIKKCELEQLNSFIINNNIDLDIR